MDRPDVNALARALRASVRTYKLLTLEQAYRYCDLARLPRTILDESA